MLGAGLSGRAAARLLLSLGKRVILIDDRNCSAEDEVKGLLARGVEGRFRAGAEALEGAEVLIVSPGIPREHPLRAAAAARELPILGELELGWCFSGEAAIVGVTGTNGKTTVTMLIAHILQTAGRSVVQAGNIGHALCDAVLESADGLAPTTYVLEVSSFQLEDARAFAPDVAVLLNVTPDHLDRHGGIEEYAAAKARISLGQSSDQALIVNQDDIHCLQIAHASPARVTMFSIDRPVDEGAWLDDDRLVLAMEGGKPKRLIDLDLLPLFGMHNVANCLAAAAAAASLGVGRSAIGAALASFAGAPHRLESVAVIDGVEFIDDSKATNIDAVAKAIGSFSAPIHLIAGGRDKASPFGTIRNAVAERAAGAYLIGEAAEKIAEAWGPAVPIFQCATLQQALEKATARAEPGEVVLLSPGCASFDQFASYAERGDAFALWVNERKQQRKEQAIAMQETD